MTYLSEKTSPWINVSEQAEASGLAYFAAENMKAK
jgi:hypothetical protein